MPNPSSYLEASLARWADRGSLARQDVGIMMDGLEVKGHFLEGLRLKILQHRKEDLAQLKAAREEARVQWDERLKRLESWIGTSTELTQASKKIRAWQNRSVWFDRAQAALSRYSAGLERKVSALEKALNPLTDWTKGWSDRLSLKEAEFKSILGGSKTEETFITSTKKSALLEYLYAAREKEGELSRHFKKLRGQVNFEIERLARVEGWLSEKADANPAYFEIRKNQALETWRPLQKRLAQTRETALLSALVFEEGRTRLRSFYDTLQKIRVVQAEAPARRPLLDRLFSPRDN